MTPPLSDHFNGKTFVFPGIPFTKGLKDLIRWRLTAKEGVWPPRVDGAPKPVPARPAAGLTATWVGQATFLLWTPEKAILTDPIFSERASPFSWIGPQRKAAPGIAFEAMPRIDLVLLSHDHFDHCDLPTLRRLAQRDQPVVLAPFGHQDLLEKAGIRTFVEMDWWQTYAAERIRITLVPAQHWSRRRPGSTNRRLWGGFFVETDDRKVYFAGDSGYHRSLFKEIRARLGSPDLALIPIGAYEPRWFMKEAHMDPAEAVQVHLDLGATQSLGMHWGTFALTDEGRDDPPQALAAAREKAGIRPEAFRVIDLGETVIG